MDMNDKGARTFLYALLIIFNVFLWTLLFAFQWEISLRIREVEYFGNQLFPVGIHIVPLPLIYGVCVLLSVASIGAILRDRNNLAARKRLQTLLERILDSLEIGVVVLDQKGVLILANDSARQLLPVTPPIPSDISILDMPQGYPEVREIVRCALQEGKFSNEVEKHLGFSESAGTVRISMLPLRKAQRKVGGILLLINDVSEEVSMQQEC